MPDKIQLKYGHLLWRAQGRTIAIEPAEVLYRFISTSKAPDDSAILEFAKTYGPLWLCERHQIAGWHPSIFSISCPLGPAPHPKDRPDRPLYHCPPKREGTDLCEPLEAWRRLAIRAQRLLAIAVHLKEGKRTDVAQWKALDGFDLDWKKLGAWDYLDDPWWRLAENLNWWLAMAQVMPHIEAKDGALRAFIGSSRVPRSVLGVIAVQLIFACQKQPDFAECSGCGATFLPDRTSLLGKRVGPWTAKRVYCPECQAKGVPVRDAKRDQRTREREVWKLHAQGLTDREIARKLKVEDPDRVSRWIKNIKGRQAS